jgi:hypothetical protein
VHRLAVAVERGHDAGPLVVVEPAVLRAVGEAPLVVLDHRDAAEQFLPCAGRRLEDDLADRPLGVVLDQRERAVLVRARERLDLVQVGAQVDPDELTDGVVGQRLPPRHEREARREPPQVPAQVPEVGLVEVVDVEDDPPGAVHVGAEVLGVQIALDPDARRPLVAPGVLRRRHVGVEQTGAAPVEGERVGGHLAELRPEGVGVGLHEVGEGVDQHADDVGGPPVEICGLGHTSG